MIARTAELMGAENIGIGTDLFGDQPDSIVEWMRVGRWTKSIDYGEGSADKPGFPPMPNWFKDNRDFGNIRNALSDLGMTASKLMASWVITGTVSLKTTLALWGRGYT